MAGYSAPGSKLWTKPNPDTSQTGEDRIALFATTRSVRAGPVTIESKVRTTYNGPQALLNLFIQPAEDRKRMRKAAWLKTVSDLTGMGAPELEFSYIMAKLMYERSSAADPCNYKLHGFLVVESAQLSDEQIDERWGGEDTDVPVDRLVVVEIDDLACVVDACFDRAAGVEARDLSPDPHDLGLDNVEGVTRGLENALSIDAADPPDLVCPTSQAALWFLANRDGLGAAASSSLAGNDDPIISAFGHLLQGRTPEMLEADLEDFVGAVKSAWQKPSQSLLEDMASISVTANQWIELHPEHEVRMRLVAAALANRLSRHPRCR